jgi:hypothetical protein
MTLKPMIFFELKFFQNNFRDFKKYIFHYCNKVKQDSFFLATRLQKVYFVKKVNSNACILLFYHNDSIYYNVFYDKVPFKDEDAITESQSGYIYFKGQIVESHKNVIDVILQQNSEEL